MKYIYLLIVRPIELILGFLFKTYVALSDNYGLSVILLSLSVTVMMFPLFYIAEVWKRKEQAVEKRMKRRLDYIKKYYTGQKRYCLIKATHRMEGYTAASSFRTSFGLLIQIPFFFAAYHLLSHYEPCRGTGWLFIRDFAIPDGLLWGVNLLPIAMTVINIVSSSIYMKGSRAREIIELYVMAGVFLLLLYSSPAVLVLYWTMNNIFSIGKSLIFLRLFPHEKYVSDPEEKSFKDYVHLIWNEISGCLTPNLISYIFVVFLFAVQGRALKIHKSSFVLLYLVTIGIAFILVLLFFVKWVKKYKKHEDTFSTLLKIVISGIIFVCISGSGFWLQLHHAEGSLLKKIVFLASIAADVLIFISTNYLIGDFSFFKSNASKDIRQNKSLYIWIVCCLSISSVILWPILVYLTSPEDTGVTLWSILGTNWYLALCFIFAALLFYFISGKKQRLWLTEMGLLLVMLVLVYHYILPCDYGELDKTMLGLEDKLSDTSLLPWLLDVFVLIFFGFTAKICVRKYSVQCRNVVVIFFICMLGMTGFRIIKYCNSDIVKVAAEDRVVQLPENNDVVNGYSKNGKNVVLFLADMFTGGYMVDILNEHPEYKDDLRGFVWYKNSLAPSYKTCGSMPSVFAGEEYWPLEMNRMQGTGLEKTQKAAEKMILKFKNAGYSVSFIDGESGYVQERTMKDIQHVRSKIYGDLWKEKYRKGVKSVNLVKQGHLLMMLTLFQNSPYFLKPVIYNESCWFIFSKKALFWTVENHVFPNYGYMKLLPEISNVNEKNNTFKYIHNSLPHGPYGVNKNGDVILPGEFPDEDSESFYFGKAPKYSTAEFLHLFIEWLNWLKEMGIYDNTCIILVSDHGNYRPDCNPIVDLKYINRLNSIFMVKPFGAREDFVIDSDTLVISSDAEKFMENSINGTEVKIPENRKLKVVQFNNSDKFLKEGVISPVNIYEVHDNIFDPKNWKVLK